MKNRQKKTKRAAAAVFALLLALLLPAAALADAWVPPDNHYIYGFETDAGARLVSLFLSNYAETGMTTYSSGTPSSKLHSVVLKDLELNASQFKDGLTVNTDAAGVQYMTVTAERYESRAGSLFPNSGMRAADCPGYSGGSITVTASNVNGPIDIAATVDKVTYEGDYVYYVDFSVWRVNVGSLSAVYGSTNVVPEAKVTKLTGGSCRFSYFGRKSVENISTWELALIDYQTGGFASASAVLEANVAYRPVSGSQAAPPASETPSPSAEPGVGTENDGNGEETETEALPEADTREGKGSLPEMRGGKETDERQGVAVRSGNTTLYVIILLAVVIIVLLAVLIIVVALKKR